MMEQHVTRFGFFFSSSFDVVLAGMFTHVLGGPNGRVAKHDVGAESETKFHFCELPGERNQTSRDVAPALLARHPHRSKT